MQFKFAFALLLVATIAYGQDAESTTPVPILKSINKVNDDGSYTYGFEAADGTFKIETRDADGNVKGKYGYIDESGLLKTVEYQAGKPGFEAKGDHLPEPVPALPVPPQPLPQAPQPVAATRTVSVSPAASISPKPSVQVPSLPSLTNPQQQFNQPQFAPQQFNQQPQFDPQQQFSQPQFAPQQSNQPQFVPQQFAQQPQFVPQQFNQQSQFVPQQQFASRQLPNQFQPEQFPAQPLPQQFQQFQPQQFQPQQRFAPQPVNNIDNSGSNAQPRGFSFSFDAPINPTQPQQPFNNFNQFQQPQQFNPNNFRSF